jgi:hypothetical protein
MKQKIKISGITYEINQDLWEKIKDLKQQNLTEVRINQKIFKLNDIELIESNIVDELSDWSAIEYKDLPEEKKVVSDEKANSNRENIKEQIRLMLRQKNKDWKPSYHDNVHREASKDVWEHLKSKLISITYPEINLDWNEDLSISHHSEGKENHSVVYKVKKIDLGDKYDSKFWAEANFIWCETCRKHIRKQIVIFNDYESECIVRNC